ISGAGAAIDPEARTPDVSPELITRLTDYFQAGGVRNVVQAMRCIAREHLGVPVSVEPGEVMPAHGLYHPHLLVPTAAEWNDHRDVRKPVVAVLFYRAHVLSGNLTFVDHLVRALERRGCAAIGLFTSSLREVAESGLPLALGRLSVPPDVIVNTVSYP